MLIAKCNSKMRQQNSVNVPFPPGITKIARSHGAAGRRKLIPIISSPSSLLPILSSVVRASSCRRGWVSLRRGHHDNRYSRPRERFSRRRQMHFAARAFLANVIPEAFARLLFQTRLSPVVFSHDKVKIIPRNVSRFYRVSSRQNAKE